MASDFTSADAHVVTFGDGNDDQGTPDICEPCGRGDHKNCSGCDCDNER